MAIDLIMLHQSLLALLLFEMKEGKKFICVLMQK